jgi:hypothetical protein
MSGARFNVISSRRSPLHRFVVQEIKQAAPAATRHSEAEQPSPSQNPSLKATPTPSLPPPAARAAGWLARIVGRKVDVPSVPPPALSRDQTSNASVPRGTHNADEYNWSGFSCPYCGASSFVLCQGGHLACDGSAELRGGHKFHQCFCGNAGFITGTIKSHESKRLSVDAGVDAPIPPERQPPRSKPADTALPPPKRGPPAKAMSSMRRAVALVSLPIEPHRETRLCASQRLSSRTRPGKAALRSGAAGGRGDVTNPMDSHNDERTV